MNAANSNGSVLLVGNFLSAHVANRSVGEEMADRLRQRRWTVITTSNRRNKLARLIDMVSTVLQRRMSYEVAQVDVFSGPAFLWAEMSCMALRAVRKPYVLTLHGGNLPAFCEKHRHRVCRLLQSAAVVTCPSRYLLDRMASCCNRLRLVPNPIDIGAYPYRARSQPRPALIWLRAFHAIYNPTLAPRALALLQSEFPALSLKMVGPDKGDGSLQATQAAARQWCPRTEIQFPGGVAKCDVPHWLDQHDVFINTTNVDNTPISVIEAMACGLNVVSTNVGGIPYLLANEHDALLVEPDNPPAMAGAIRRLLRESGLAQRISSAARRKVEEFDWSRVLPQWEAMFLGLSARSMVHPH